MRTAFLILLAVQTFAQPPAHLTLPPDSEIRQILASRVGAENLGVGIVVGVIDANGRRNTPRHVSHAKHGTMPTMQTRQLASARAQRGQTGNCFRPTQIGPDC